MRITILNGDMSGSASDFTQTIANLSAKLEGTNTVDLYHLNQMNLHYCTGCWSCWWKTPGECALKDEAESIFRSVINSDFLIFASPLMAGFTSSALKNISDRLIVLLHPYIQIKDEECHHCKRYETYPDFGLLLQKEMDTDEEDIEIVNSIYKRLSLNFHNNLKYIEFIDKLTIEKIIHETCHN
jgi:hypothetical protein